MKKFTLYLPGEHHTTTVIEEMTEWVRDALMKGHPLTIKVDEMNEVKHPTTLLRGAEITSP